MAHFNFQRLINKYSRKFTLISESEGEYNRAGKWQDGITTETELEGAILGYAESKIHRSEGTLTANDKVLHTLTPIDNALMGGKVIFNGNLYSIETQKGKDNADFTGVYSYTLKYVSAFDKGGGNNV